MKYADILLVIQSFKINNFNAAKTNLNYSSIYLYSALEL